MQTCALCTRCRAYRPALTIVDLVIVRENTEDLYKGIEYMLNDEIANGVKLITRPALRKDLPLCI